MRLIVDEDGELYDSGKTQERCPAPECGGQQVWRQGPWKSRFLACSRFPKCEWTPYKKVEAVAVDAVRDSLFPEVLTDA